MYHFISAVPGSNPYDSKKKKIRFETLSFKRLQYAFPEQEPEVLFFAFFADFFQNELLPRTSQTELRLRVLLRNETTARSNQDGGGEKKSMSDTPLLMLVFHKRL